MGLAVNISRNGVDIPVAHMSDDDVHASPMLPLMLPPRSTHVATPVASMCLSTIVANSFATDMLPLLLPILLRIPHCHRVMFNAVTCNLCGCL